ncbi:hypothetical protein DXG01_009062 [Tephrocybe rancida]|nr:hypothetical protein DXG01_009062 [Tephrocybe rancida]
MILTSITSVKQIGLAPDVADLNAFVAAAGFADAAVTHGLPNPPFILGGWATAEFTFPADSGLNGTMRVNTTGIQTNAFCANPVETNLNQTAPNSFSLTSKSVEGCTANVTYDPTAFNITASTNLGDSSLSAVDKLNQYVPDNNVTGSPLNGQAYNGVIFPNNANPFIQARSLATRSGVPGAIFRFASQKPDGPQSTFDLPNGFLDITSTVYTQHLSIAAKSIYFVNANTSLTAETTSLVPVLWIDPFPAHVLAILLMFVGIAGIVIQVLHQPQRRKVLLTAPPGTIAAAVSLTARSGFGELLLPYDDEDALERKLSGLSFRLDRRTGAIVADDVRTERYGRMGPDDATISLLGQSRSVRDSNASSSTLAYQAASGYPPWRTPYDP